MHRYENLSLIFFLFTACTSKKAVIFETAEITYFNPEYGEAKMYSNKFNATTFLVNARANITKEIPSETMAAVNIYKLSDNTYKKTALSIKRNLCRFVESPEIKIMWSSYMAERTILPKNCPIEKGFYSATDIDPNMLEGIDFFNFLPSWSIKVESILSIKNEPLMNLVIRLKVMEVI